MISPQKLLKAPEFVFGLFLTNTQLSEKLGYLPLALELASRYLNGHPRLPITNYLEQTKEAIEHPSMKDWRKDLPAPTQHDLDLQRTFALSWQAVKDETAQKMFQVNDRVDKTGNLQFFATLRSHILSVAGFVEGTSDILINVQSAAGLLGNLGYHLLRIADYAGAKSASERALMLAESVLEPNHPNLALYANNLGMVLQDLGDLSGACAAYERALKIDEAAFGPDHPKVAIRVNNLGGVLQALGDLSGARAAYERALEIFEKQLRGDHPHFATLVNNLGDVLQDLGDLSGARAAFERALKIDEAAFGPGHPKVARDVNNLGMVMQDLGDLSGARAAFERALKIFKQFLPPDHPNIKIVQGNLDSLNGSDKS